jgi:two-component system cell cycle response regulator
VPRLTSRVFTDLAIWMVGFGLVIGLVFPPFCLLLGLPSDRVLSPMFYASTTLAGLLVGGFNFILARLVVGRRIRLLATGMQNVESQLAGAVYTQDWSGCVPGACALPVDSQDEIGASATAFNRLIGTLSHSHGVQTAMRAFSTVLSSRFDIDELAATSLEAMLDHTGADAGALLVVREATLEALASHGLRETEHLAASDHVRRALRRGQIEHLALDASNMVIDTVLVGQAAREIMIVPVAFKSVPLGAVVGATARRVGTDAQHLMETFRADLGLAINNALAHERLERLAAIDPLTDAYNRRFGMNRLNEEFSRAIRSENPLGVLMLDLDHFKNVNDTYGHLVGDRVLRAVARTCRRMIREGDVLIRYGGEEFLVLLPGAGLTDVTDVGERLRRATAETWVVEGDQRIAVTISAGGAVYGDAVASPEELIARADAELLKAKQAGRDQLVVD